ncbi:hypothetical protein FQA39_LY17550 [Lamprigera yunnana]|nr:hypothetical protein FQA39_LY17550 [Lamprigera yunnana]
MEILNKLLYFQIFVVFVVLSKNVTAQNDPIGGLKPGGLVRRAQATPPPIQAELPKITIPAVESPVAVEIQATPPPIQAELPKVTIPAVESPVAVEIQVPTLGLKPGGLVRRTKPTPPPIQAELPKITIPAVESPVAVEIQATPPPIQAELPKVTIPAVESPVAVEIQVPTLGLKPGGLVRRTKPTPPSIQMEPSKVTIPPVQSSVAVTIQVPTLGLKPGGLVRRTKPTPPSIQTEPPKVTIPAVESPVAVEIQVPTVELKPGGLVQRTKPTPPSIQTEPPKVTIPSVESYVTVAIPVPTVELKPGGLVRRTKPTRPSVQTELPTVEVTVGLKPVTKAVSVEQSTVLPISTTSEDEAFTTEGPSVKPKSKLNDRRSFGTNTTTILTTKPAENAEVTSSKVTEELVKSTGEVIPTMNAEFFFPSLDNIVVLAEFVDTSATPPRTIAFEEGKCLEVDLILSTYRTVFVYYFVAYYFFCSSSTHISLAEFFFLHLYYIVVVAEFVDTTDTPPRTTPFEVEFVDTTDMPPRTTPFEEVATIQVTEEPTKDSRAIESKYFHLLLKETNSTVLGTAPIEGSTYSDSKTREGSEKTASESEPPYLTSDGTITFIDLGTVDWSSREPTSKIPYTTEDDAEDYSTEGASGDDDLLTNLTSRVYLRPTETTSTESAVRLINKVKFETVYDEKGNKFTRLTLPFSIKENENETVFLINYNRFENRSTTDLGDDFESVITTKEGIRCEVYKKEDQQLVKFTIDLKNNQEQIITVVKEKGKFGIYLYKFPTTDFDVALDQVADKPERTFLGNLKAFVDGLGILGTIALVASGFTEVLALTFMILLFFHRTSDCLKYPIIVKACDLYS